MTIGEQLLELADEYRTSKQARAYDMADVSPSGREPSIIAAEYEAKLKELLA